MAYTGPFNNSNFLVAIDGISQSGFSECTGLESSVGVIEYREGGDFLVRKLPGLRKFANITLKRGVVTSAELQSWHKNILDGQFDRRNGSITLLDDARQEVVRWNFFNAFPVKWEGPNLSATGNDVAMESVELCCERIERG
jgi:phage tail-like protein